MDSQEINVNINELTIAGQRWGKPGGIPTLALHGWLDNAASFELIAPYLHKLDLVSIDMPGHGRSGHLPKSAIYHFTDAIPYVVAVADSLGWSEFALLGHSMGAGVASLIAGTFPSRISHVLLIEGLGPLVHPSETAPEQLAEFYNHFTRNLDDYNRLYNTIEDAAKARTKKGYLPPKPALVLTSRGAKKTGEGYHWRHDPRLLFPSPLRLTEEQVLAFIDRISAPVCLINATEGFKYDRKAMVKRIQHCNAIDVHELDGGHHIHMEKPREVAELFQTFLGS